ncbi:MAG: Na(+)/H(+) antiporter NhaA, partial [Pseudopedobacter saltans]
MGTIKTITKVIKSSAIQFTRSSKSTGILLIICTLLSLVLSNLSFGENYILFWENKNTWLHSAALPSNIIEWINDGLMALFFLTAGMEIKRELLDGELNTLKKAILPLFAAIGGVLAPALIFVLICKGTNFAHGWGIPTATDIAFSIGILSILGRKFVPEPLKIFITALAIIDDLIAIIIVAFCYGGSIAWLYLIGVILVILAIYFLYKKIPNTGILHILFGIILWYLMFKSGIHATMAGVIFGFLKSGEPNYPDILKRSFVAALLIVSFPEVSNFILDVCDGIASKIDDMSGLEAFMKIAQEKSLGYAAAKKV